ncbi:MAG: hypothetical protein DSM106950_21090 [Stigonema ocellatum SAG 48.90 = DSM 106950]|nr:hypothetical protein [Stigonema ocellatum SAG 48.90 = DSM 106950]
MKLTEQMTFRTSKEILGEVKKIADNSGKTSSQVINELLFKVLGLDPKDKEQGDKIEEIRQEMRLEIRQAVAELEQRFSQVQEEALKK